MSKQLIGVGIAVVGLAAAIFGYFGWGQAHRQDTPSETISVESSSSEQISSESDEEEQPYQSPIDFESLQAENPDIYAWIRIPDTQVDYPIFQSDESDEYYLRRNIQKAYAIEGVLFTEKSYNGKTFDDPATVIYGHRMTNGSMFGSLQPTYSDAASFETHRDITIYLPDEEKHYTVFASVPYSKWHILYNYDFSDVNAFWRFFDKIYDTRSLDANFAQDVEISPEDKILILSTCLKGDSNRRYLVLAKLTEQNAPA